MKNQKIIPKNTLLKKQQKKGRNSQKNKQNQKLKKSKTYFGKNAEVTETEEYVEVSVTYDVIENIGMQEKINEINEQTEKAQ